MSIFGSTSRFKLTDLINFRGNIVPGLMTRFDFLDNLSNDETINVEVLGPMAGRPDLISNRLYGTPDYKWILIMLNNVTNPFDGWPKAGTTIKAPTNQAVWREL